MVQRLVQRRCNDGATTVQTEEERKKGRSKEERSKEEAHHQPHRSAHSTDEVGDAFDRFWSVVHHKVGKGHARKAFQRAVKGGTPAEVIIAAMTEFAQTPDASPRDRTPIHPTTWINAERWDDDRGAWQVTGGLFPTNNNSDGDGEDPVEKMVADLKKYRAEQAEK